MDRDSAYSRVFSFPDVVRDFLKEFVDAPWARTVEHRGFELKGLPASREFQERANILVWDVSEEDGPKPVMGLLLQFQDEDEPITPASIAVKVSTLLLRQAERDGLPVRPVVAIVLYGGTRRYTQVLDLRDRIGRDPPISLYRMQPSVPYRVVEERFCPMLNRPDRNLGVLLFQAERTRSVQEFVHIVERFAEALREPEGGHAGLERAIVEWLREVVLKARAPGLDFSGVETFDALLKETERLVKPRVEAQGEAALVESREAARIAGIKWVLGSLARKKFGDRLGGMVADAIAPNQSAEQLLKVGSLITNTQNGSDLLKLLRELWGTPYSPDGLPDVGIQ